jgi:hypothetical protein
MSHFVLLKKCKEAPTKPRGLTMAKSQQKDTKDQKN